MKPIKLEQLQSLFKTGPNPSKSQQNGLNQINSVFSQYCNSVTKNNALDGSEVDMFLNALSKKCPNITETIRKHIVAPPSSTDLSKVPDDFKEKYNVDKVTLPNGKKILACSYGKYDKCQKEMLGKMEIMQKAADALGLTLVFGDGERPASVSDAVRRKNPKKRFAVAPGGESPHNYGCAVDIVLCKNGQLCAYGGKEYKEFAEKVKAFSNSTIMWGGDYTDPKKARVEQHHFEINNWENKYKSKQFLIP